MNFVIPLNNAATDTITPRAADGSTQAVGSLSLKIDDYATAYVGKYPNAGLNGYIVVPKASFVGVKTVNVTATATDVNGNALPPITRAYDVDGTTPPPLATGISFGTATAGAFPGVPPDPGVDTVKLV